MYWERQRILDNYRILGLLNFRLKRIKRIIESSSFLLPKMFAETQHLADMGPFKNLKNKIHNFGLKHRGEKSRGQAKAASTLKNYRSHSLKCG